MYCKKTSDDKWNRLIHKKTGDVKSDNYFWNEEKDTDNLKKKVKELKRSNFWEMTRELYINKKNLNINANKPSFICYIEAVNDAYNKLLTLQQKNKLAKNAYKSKHKKIKLSSTKY